MTNKKLSVIFPQNLSQTFSKSISWIWEIIAKYLFSYYFNELRQKFVKNVWV